MKQQPDIHASYSGDMGLGNIAGWQLRQSDPRQISMQPIQVDPRVAATFSERGREQDQGPHYQLQSNQTDTMTGIGGSMQGNRAGGQRQSSHGDTVVKQGRGDMSQSGSLLEIPYMVGKVNSAGFSEQSLGHGAQVAQYGHYAPDEIYGNIWSYKRDARKSKNRSSAKVASSQSESILKGRVSQTHGNSIQIRNVQFDLDSKEAQQIAKLKLTKMPRPRKQINGPRGTSGQKSQQVQNAGAAVNIPATQKDFTLANEFRKLVGSSTPLADSNMRYQLLKGYNPPKYTNPKNDSAGEACAQPKPNNGTATSQEWTLRPEGATSKTIQSQKLSNKSFSNKIINEMTQLTGNNNNSAIRANRTQYGTNQSVQSMAYLDFQQPYQSNQSFTDATFQKGFQTATNNDTSFFQRRAQSCAQPTQGQDRYAAKNLNILQSNQRRDLYVHRKKNKSKIAFSMKQGNNIIIKDIPKKQLIQEIERQQQNQRLHEEMEAAKPRLRSPSAQPYLTRIWSKRYAQTKVMEDARRRQMNISSMSSMQNQLEGAKSGKLSAYRGGSGSPSVPGLVRYPDSALFYNPLQSYTTFNQPQKFQSISSIQGSHINPIDEAGLGKSHPLNVFVDMQGGGSNQHSKSLLEHTTTIHQPSPPKMDSRKDLDDNRGDAPQQVSSFLVTEAKHASSQNIDGKGLGRNYSQFPDTEADHKFGSIITPTSLHQDIIKQFQTFENPQAKAAQANEATMKSKRKSQNTNSNTQASKTFNGKEQEIKQLSSRNLDYDIAQNAQFTNESLKFNQMKRLDLQKMMRQPLDDPAAEINKDQAKQYSRDSSSALYGTQDQVYFAKRLASQEQSEIASGLTHDSAAGKAAQKTLSKKYSDQGIKLSDQSQKNLNITVAQNFLAVQDQELKQRSTAKFVEQEKSNSITLNGKSPQPEPKKDQNQGKIEENNEIKSKIVSYEEDLRDNGKDKKSLVDEKADQQKVENKITPPCESAQGTRGDENPSYDLIAAKSDLFQMTAETKDGPKAISGSRQTLTTKELLKLKRRVPLADLVLSGGDRSQGRVQQASREKNRQFNNQKEAFQAAYNPEYKQELTSVGKTNYDDDHREEWQGIEVRQAYYMDVIQNQLYKNRFPGPRSRPRSSSDTKIQRERQPTIRQINALKERIVERDGGEYNESSLSHIISMRPGPEDCPEDAEDEEKKKTMLAEANWLKQIRKQRYLEGQLQIQPVPLDDKKGQKIADLINDPPIRPHTQSGLQANSNDDHPDSQPSPRSRSPQREVRASSVTQELKPKDLHVQRQKSSASRKRTPQKMRANKSQRQLNSKDSPLKAAESRSQLSKSPSHYKDSKIMSYQERYGSKNRQLEGQCLAEYVPNIPITENQKIKIARHLVAIMTDIEASRRLDYPERHELFIQLSRYLQKLTQATENSFNKPQKVMLRGKDRRAEVIEKCAQTIVHFVSHPDVIDRTSMGTGRLSLLQYVESQAQEAIHAGISQQQDNEKNKELFTMLQKQREIRLQKKKKQRGSDFDGEVSCSGLSGDSGDESEGEEADEDDHSDVEIPSSRTGSNLRTSSKQAKKRKRVKKQKLRKVKSKPKFILKDISQLHIDELSDSEPQIIEKTQSMTTQRNMCRGKHTLDKYRPVSVTNQPKYFTFDEHIYDIEVLFSRKRNMEKPKSTDDQNGFFSPNLLRRSSLLEDIDSTWLSTILGKVMSENPDNVVRHDRIRNHMALNDSGIRDVFMTSQHPRMTLEQQEYLIIEEIMENCLRAHKAPEGVERSIEEVYQERYQKEIQRRARTFCERQKVTMVTRVDFGVITNEDKPQPERNEASKDGEDERNAREHQQSTLEETNELKPPPQSILKKKGSDSGFTQSDPTSLATTPKSKDNKDKGGHNSGSRPSGDGAGEVRRASRRMIGTVSKALSKRVNEMQKPFVMDDDTRSFFDSVLTNDWQNVLRLCRKVQNIVNKTNEKEQKPLQLAFKYQSYEAAGVLMRFGAGHPSCPENIEKCKSFIEALVKGNLYEADYDLDPTKPNCEAEQVAEGIRTIQLNQIQAVLETLDPIFDRLVYDQISNLQKLDESATMSRRKKGQHPLGARQTQMLAQMDQLDVDSYNSQMQYIRDLIIEGKLEDYERIVKEYIQSFDGPKKKKARDPDEFY